MSKKKKRTPAEIELLIASEHGRIEVWDNCLHDATDRATNCFLADQDEAAYLFRDQLRRLRLRSSEACGRLCDLLLELNNAKRQ